MTRAEHLFVLEDGKYRPTLWARGPWDPSTLHGGAPAALLAHALEAERRDPALWITRLTIDLMRPIRTAAAFTMRTQIVREGKRILLADAMLFDDEKLVARASGLMLRRSESALQPMPATRLMPSWEELAPYPMGIGAEPQLFHRGTEFRPVPKTHPEQPLAVWIRIPFLLLPDRPLSRIEYAAAISDYVNAIGGMANPGRGGFINADITLNLHREPEDEWLCIESIARPDHAGIATSTVLLHDTRGLLGSISACVLANGLAKGLGSDTGLVR